MKPASLPLFPGLLDVGDVVTVSICINQEFRNVTIMRCGENLSLMDTNGFIDGYFPSLCNPKIKIGDIWQYEYSNPKGMIDT